MTIDENGFLDADIEECVRTIEAQHRPVFDICFRVNSLAQRLKFDFRPSVDDLQQVLTSLLFVRILNGFQATVVLSKRGLSVEARVIARTIFEAFFHLKQLCEDSAYAQRFLADSEARRLNHINHLLNQPSRLLTPDLTRELENEKAAISSKDISTASKLHLPQIIGEFYDVYRVLSDQVHPTACSVQQCLGARESTGDALIEWGPSTSQLEPTLILGCEIVTTSLNNMCHLFDREAESDLRDLDSALSPLRERLLESAEWASAIRAVQ